MFKLAPSDSYKCAIQVELPGGEKHTFDALFRRFEQSQVDDLYQQLAENAISEDELVKKVLVGWDKVSDEDGTPLDFTAHNLERLLEVFPMRSTLATAWVDSLTGAREKNLRTPPASGRRG